MNNSLSRQLCELCGIEYEKQEPVAATDGVVQGYAKTKLDFTKPENFVRLFNLTLPIRGIPTIAEFVTFEHLTITDSKDFLQKLIKSIQEPYTRDEVIKSIREAEWVYE